jgi:hypothetical protein
MDTLGEADSELESIAIHEAGHAVIGLALGLGLLSIDLEPDELGGRGHTSFEPAGPWFEESRDFSPEAAGGELAGRRAEFIERVVTTYLAGYVAESKQSGRDAMDSAGFDFREAVMDWLNLELLNDEERMVRLATLRDRARALVERHENWQAIEALAAELLRRRRLSGREARTLLESLTVGGAG